MKYFQKILLLAFVCLQLTSFAQQPDIENIKVTKNPYLQFNDIIEYRGEVLFVTNDGVYKNNNGKINLVVKKENLARFIKAGKTVFVWSIYGEFFELKNNNLYPMPFNSLVSKRLKNKIINHVIYYENTLLVSTVIGGGIVKIDRNKEEVKTIEIKPEYPYYVTQFGENIISGNNSNSSKKDLIINLKKNSFQIPLAENLNFSKSNILKLQDGSYVFTRQYEAIRFNTNKIINRVFIENNIENIYQSTNGKIWFTLNNGGVVCFTDGKFNSNSSIRYLGNKTVISVFEDSKGNMWFGTSGDGLYLLKKPIELNYNAPKIFSSTNNKTEEIKSVSIISELPTSNENSKVISTDVLKNDSTPPIVFINNIKINGNDTSTLNYYALTYKENNLEINISGIYGGKSGLQYKYILQGKEKEWNYTTTTSIHYTSLKPGNYTFKIYAMSDGGVWSKVPAVITFSIAPPLYTSFWFIFSVIFLIVILVFIIAFIGSRKAHKRNKLFEEEKRKVLISELHALRSQMNPHFIFNTLSSIQSFITKNSSKDAVLYLSKFSKLMRATLENTQKQQIPIKDEIETLELYLDLEKLRLNNKFDYKIIIDKSIDIQFEEIPPMLIQPYLENAIWHGISHKKGNGEIIISFKLENENMLKCVIQDDGIGRVSAMEKRESQNKSLGMSITKERLELINSLKKSKLSVNIIDLEKNDVPKGTKIELFIPLD